MFDMLSLENATPLIYSNVGLFGAFVCSPLVVATALAVEHLSLAFKGTSAFSQEQQTEPAPAPKLHAAPTPAPTVSISFEPSAPVVAAARGIDAATGSGSNSPTSNSSTGDVILVNDTKADTDDDDLAQLWKKAWSGQEDGASESGSSDIVSSSSYSRQSSPMARSSSSASSASSSASSATAPSASPALPFIIAAPLPAVTKRVSRPDFSDSFKALLPCISPTLPALKTASATVAKETAKPKVAPTSENLTSKPSSSAKVPDSVVVAAAPKIGSPLRPSSPATPRTSSPLTSPARPHKFKPTSPARLSLLALRSVVPSPTQPSTSRARDAPLPPSAAARPAAAKSSPSTATSPSAANVSPTLISPSKVAPEPTPELTPPSTPPPRRKLASPFNGALRLAPSTPSSPTSPPIPSSSAPFLAPLPLRREEVKAASPSPTTASSSPPPAFTFTPFADISVALPPRSIPTSTSSTSTVPNSAVPIPSTASLLPSLPIASLVAASDRPKFEGLESSRWAYPGYEEKVAAKVRAEKEKNAPAEAAYGVAQINYLNTLTSSPLGADITPPTVPAHLMNKRPSDNFMEEEESGSKHNTLGANVTPPTTPSYAGSKRAADEYIEKDGSSRKSSPPAVATPSANMAVDDSVDDSPRAIRPLRRGRLPAVPGSQLNPLAAPVAIAPCTPAPAVFPFPQDGFISMAVDFERSIAIAVEPSVNAYSSGFEQYSQDSYMDAQPELSNPDRSYLQSWYDHSSFPTSTSASSLPIDVNSHFDYPATPLANLFATTGFASFASLSPPSSFQPSSMEWSYAAISAQSTPSFFTSPPRDYTDIDAEVRVRTYEDV